MAMKPQAKVVHKSMQGRVVDIDQLRQKNEMTLAVSNVRMNARGDELGPNGQIVRKREDVVSDYYTGRPQQ
jgi:hypothetical protein